MEAYERLKRDGAVATLDYGTPIVYALTPRHMDDKIPAITPGFGRADSTDGDALDLHLPDGRHLLVAGGRGHEVHQGQRGQAGHEGRAHLLRQPGRARAFPIVEAVAKKEGYQLRLFAVPPPGVEMGPQVIDITRRFKADWVIGHLFGQSPDGVHQGIQAGRGSR